MIFAKLMGTQGPCKQGLLGCHYDLRRSIDIIPAEGGIQACPQAGRDPGCRRSPWALEPQYYTETPYLAQSSLDSCLRRNDISSSFIRLKCYENVRKKKIPPRKHIGPLLAHSAQIQEKARPESPFGRKHLADAVKSLSQNWYPGGGPNRFQNLSFLPTWTFYEGFGGLEGAGWASG